MDLPASVCSVVLGCLSPVPQSLHVLLLCPYGLSLPAQCAVLTALSARGLEGSSGGLSTIQNSFYLLIRQRTLFIRFSWAVFLLCMSSALSLIRSALGIEIAASVFSFSVS